MRDSLVGMDVGMDGVNVRMGTMSDSLAKLAAMLRKGQGFGRLGDETEGCHWQGFVGLREGRRRHLQQGHRMAASF